MIKLPRIKGKKTGNFATSYAKGLAQETKASRSLESKGYVVLSRRAKTIAGELDLILRAPDQNCIVFLEIKRSQQLGDDIGISQVDQKRLLRAADSWIRSKPEYQGFRMRFDRCLIDKNGKIQHIENTFSLS